MRGLQSYFRRRSRCHTAVMRALNPRDLVPPNAQVHWADATALDDGCILGCAGPGATASSAAPRLDVVISFARIFVMPGNCLHHNVTIDNTTHCVPKLFKRKIYFDLDFHIRERRRIYNSNPIYLRAKEPTYLVNIGLTLCPEAIHEIRA